MSMDAAREHALWEVGPWSWCMVYDKGRYLVGTIRRYLAWRLFQIFDWRFSIGTERYIAYLGLL